MLEVMLLNTLRRHSISHAKLAPGWALIEVNFDPIQENGPIVGAGRSFARLRQYNHVVQGEAYINDVCTVL